jgi:hypothetical protein
MLLQKKIATQLFALLTGSMKTRIVVSVFFLKSQKGVTISPVVITSILL